MDIVQFFESQRTDYLKAFEIMKTRLTQQDFYLLTEPIDKESNSEYFSFFRYDFLVKTNESEGYINTTTNVNPTLFESAQLLKYDSIEMLLQSFVWNGCKLTFDINIKIDFLNQWYEKSIQIDNERYDATIKNVIHSVTFIDNKTAIIDFGTVNSKNLFDLFGTLKISGVSKIIIESSYE
jgi:hypothetical protein